MAKDTKKTKSKGEKGATKLDIASLYSNTIDVIEKRQGVDTSSLDVAPPMSTGLLQVDMMLGGGIRSSMITGAGNEQCAKTTLALNVMANSINEDIPIIAFVDYEGCVTADTLIGYSKGKHKALEELFDLQHDWEEDSWIDQQRTDIDTYESGHADRGTGVRTAQLFYRGIRPIFQIETSSGNTLRGYRHKMFVLSGSKLRIKLLEDLEVGDVLLVARSEVASPYVEPSFGYDSQNVGVVGIPIDLEETLRHYALTTVEKAYPTGKKERVFDVSLLGVGGDEVPHSIITNGLLTHNSTKNSKPYVQSILKGSGIKLTYDQVFGKKDKKTGEWLIKPRVRYRAEAVLEKFYDWLSQILRELPDKRYVAGQWWLVFDEKNKKHVAKVGSFADKEMGRRYGNGLWVPAPNDKIQGIIFVDSYTAMNPAVKDEESISNQLSVKASAFSKQLERIKGRMVEKMVAVYGLNHLRANPMAMFGPKEDEKGGNALKTFSDVRIRQTSRSLSGPKAYFSPKPGKKGGKPTFNEIESSVENGGKDEYRYVHLKTNKNKLWTPHREGWIRIWVEDGAGIARGIDPFFDVMAYLKDTRQVSGNRANIKLNLEGLGKAKRSLTWLDCKLWVLGTKEDMIRISKQAGYPPMSLKSFCFKQMKSGVAEDLFVKARAAKDTEKKSDEDEDDSGEE